MYDSLENLKIKSSFLYVQPTLYILQSLHALARPPISNYHVAAVGLGSDGRVFVGVNLEFPGLPLHHSVHAEQFLFGPYDLLDDQTPLLLEPHHNGLSLTGPISDDNRENRQNLSNGFSDHNLCNGVINNSVYNSALLKAAAMEAANESHAPYTNCPSGVALMDSEGKVYKGSYAESAAYNPTLGPFQAALIAFVAGGGGGYDRIVAAALVEKEEAKVKQEDTARLLLKAVSPKCELKVFHCSSSANFCKKATN
nr:cytidine deaminase 1-like [Ipomoea batatas]